MKGKIVVLVSCALCIFHGPAFAQDVIEATKTGDLEKVKAWLDKDPGLARAKDDRGCTPLHFASEIGHKGIAVLLIDRGAEVDARDINANTALQYAARKGQVPLAELLLGRGADINARNKDGQTALHTAATYSQKALFTVLVEKGAVIDLRDNQGGTPLIRAIWRIGDMDVVRLLADRGADINAKIEGSWVTPIAMAAQYGHRDIVNFLLDKGAIVDERSRLLFRFSVMQGLDRLFKILVEKGADLKAGTNNGGTFLHFAAEGGSEEIIKTMVEKGFNVNEPDRYGWTPLHYAVYNGRKSAVAWLSSHAGTDLDKRNLSGKTPLNMAVERNDREIAELLASRGANQAPQKFPVLEGDYLGQKRPGDQPELFAVDIVSSPWSEHGNVTFSPDGRTMYWTSDYRTGPNQGAMRVYPSRLENGRWTPPRGAFFSNTLGVNDDVPFASPDGRRMFFMSKRPVRPGGGTDKENYWVIDKTEAGWSEPRLISEALSRVTIRWQISVSGTGTLYFGSTDAGGRGGNDIYRCRFVNGSYAQPENLGEPVNTELSETAPFIAPDESYLIFGREGRPDRPGGGLHISFKDSDGRWTNPINMGEAVNSGPTGSPYVTPDGKYLFFNTGRNGNYDIFWVDAKIINELKSKK